MKTIADLLFDPDLSWQAKAIAIAIAWKQDVFQNPETMGKNDILVSLGKEARGSVYASLRELIRKEWITNEKIAFMREGKRIVGVLWKPNFIVSLDSITKAPEIAVKKEIDVETPPSFRVSRRPDQKEIKTSHHGDDAVVVGVSRRPDQKGVEASSEEVSTPSLRLAAGLIKKGLRRIFPPSQRASQAVSRRPDKKN